MSIKTRTVEPGTSGGSRRALGFRVPGGEAPRASLSPLARAHSGGDFGRIDIDLFQLTFFPRSRAEERGDDSDLPVPSCSE